MSLLKTISVITLSLTFAATSGQTIIKGKILHYKGNEIVSYQSTVEGIFTPYWDAIKPDSKGNFTIKVNNSVGGFGTTKLYYCNLFYRFFHDNHSRIYLEIDRDLIGNNGILSNWVQTGKYNQVDSIKQIATKEISGDFVTINKFYNSEIRTCYYSTRQLSDYYSNLVYHTTSSESVNNILDSLIQKEKSHLNQALLSLDIERTNPNPNISEIKDFLEKEITTFYGAIFLSGMSKKLYNQRVKLKNDSLAEKDIYNSKWEKLIEDFAEEVYKDPITITNSPDFLDFAESFLLTLDEYRSYKFPETKSPDEYVVDGLLNVNNRVLTDKNSRLAYLLSKMQMYLNDQLFYSPILLSAYYQIEEEYPDSKNLEYYKPQVEKIKNYLDAASSEFTDAKIIRKKYDTFNDLVTRFSGHNVLLDIWATWCHPCIEEFKNIDQTEKLVDSLGVDMLFISIDKPEWDDRWRQSIKINKLAGYHYRADREFIVDMWKTVGGMTGAIPRYVLIDKEGKIFVETAYPPSFEEDFKNQIIRLTDTASK